MLQEILFKTADSGRHENQISEIKFKTANFRAHIRKLALNKQE
jgi:hypothetical protein